MERYLRYRLLWTDQRSDGWYARLRPFVEWCERVGVHSVGALRGADVGEYYDQRRTGRGVDCQDREMRILEEFCQFLDDVGATGVDELAPRVPRPRRRANRSSSGTATTTDEPSSGASRRRPRVTPPAPVKTNGPDGPTPGQLEYEIDPDESITSAVVRVASAVDGRSPQFMPPLRNVLDPRALDALFEAKPEGTPRTGGRLSFVYGNCQVRLENGEYLTLRPLATVHRDEPLPGPRGRPPTDGPCRRSPHSRHEPAHRDAGEDEHHRE